MNLVSKLGATLLFSAATFSFAQESKAIQLVDAVAKNYQSKKNIYFKFLHSGAGKKPQTGIFYATPSQYLLKIMGVEQLYDGTKIYNISRSEQEVTVAKPKAGDRMLSPISYLDNYRQKYTLSYLGKKGALEMVKMTPKNAEKGGVVTLSVHPATSTIRRVEESSVQGNQRIDITDYKANQALPAGTFSFNRAAYKNYLITEL